eukprot:CAMPEP_0170512790 /NCGR_PEP_ID=MMETSP0208-20121228/67042_1 /TAXON_ID=197538 /ORGANISM="Strombidium inclinatum, Strain S3" /LENGTH=62 /DNA_ID=CAMNT_0010796455 /DNA_START=1648 /DNA_END=1836 /DNA_ORIENTATION=-
MKLKPRAWETIEDKLKSLDVRGDVPETANAKSYKKDFVKQIKDHIKEIIQTGKGRNMSSFAR